MLAQRHEREWWRRVYLDGGAGHKPVLGKRAAASARKILARHGLALDDVSGRVVLEVGTGAVGLIGGLDGLFGDGPDGPRLIGVDPLMDFYVTEIGLLDPTRLELHAGEAETLPLPSGSVDVAYCGNTLDHVRDPRQCIAELARVLRPGGRCLVSVNVLVGPCRPAAPVLDLVDRLHPHHLTRGQVHRMLAGWFPVVDVTYAGRLPRGVSWKVDLAGLVMRRVCFTCRAGSTPPSEREPGR